MKKLLSLTLVLVLILSLVPVAQAAESGRCGDNATWTLTEDGTLTISGTGPMYDYGLSVSNETPWNSSVITPTRFVIEPGITHIGAFSFLASSSCLEELSLPEGLVSIGEGAFTEVELLSPMPNLKLPSTLKIIGDQAFRNTMFINGFTIPAGVTYVGNEAFGGLHRLDEVIFEGDAPTFGATAFNETETKIVYPKGNPSWEGVANQNYGGTLTWEARDMNPQTKFTDVDPDQFYYNAVVWALKNDVTGGISDTEFGPMRNCSRAQVVTFLWRAKGRPAPEGSENPFKDVLPGAYYYDAVLWAKEQGITSGISANEFGTTRNVTRGEFVTFLWRAEGKPAGLDGNPYVDVEEGQFYYDAILWATRKGITGGIAGGKFAPMDNCTRGQVVTFLYRAYGIEHPVIDPPAKVEVNMIAAEYSDKSAQWWEDFVNGFNLNNQTIALNVEVVSWDMIYDVVDLRVQAGEAPDLLIIDGFGSYQEMLLPVEKWVSQETCAKFYPNFLEQLKVDGTLWAIPDLASTRALYYNPDYLAMRRVQAPTTWEELEAVCTAIKEASPDSCPFGVDMSANEGFANFAYFTWNNGGGFTDANGSWALNSKQNAEAMEYIAGLVNAGLTNPNPLEQTRYDLQQMFIDWELPMMIAPDTFGAMLKSGDYSVNWEIVPIPTNTGASYAQGVMDCIMCFDNGYSAEELAAITAVMDAFYEDENYVDWVRMEGFLPATTTGIAACAKLDSRMETWGEILSTARFYPVDKAEWWDVRNGVTEAQARILQGEDAQKVLDELQASIAG